MTHEPECRWYAKDPYQHLKCQNCDRIRKAFQRGYTAGYNDHARAQQHWQDTHGAYTQHGEGTNP